MVLFTDVLASIMHKLISDFKELIDMHGETQFNTLTRDEVDIVKAVLDLRDKTVLQCMTSLDHVFMLSIESKLDKETLSQVGVNMYLF
jgi:metal transporter CNNM